MNIMPWESYTDKSNYNKYTRCYKKIFEHLPDSDLQEWRKGDIVQFENGLVWSESNTWLEWFLSEGDYMNFLKDNPKKRRPVVPIYAALQYAIIIGRYRTIKRKVCGIYYDYGSVVLMLTGAATGHCRGYSGLSPFIKVSNFPHSKLPQKINKFSDTILAYKEDSEESRNKLVSTLYNMLN